MPDHPDYQDQTAVNTSTGWMGERPEIDVDLAGMGDYAMSMVRIQWDLLGRLGYLADLAQLPMEAWGGNTINEARYIQGRVGENYRELTRYAQELSTALLHIGMAAQTIADAYGSSDGWSAASLDAVRYAFGDKSVPRPAGLPETVGETYLEQQRERAGEPIDPTSPAWRSWDRVEDADGTVTQTATAANGQRIEIVTTTTLGVTTTTTKVYSPDGQVLSTQRQRTVEYADRFGVGSVTTTTGPDGTSTSHESVDYGPDGSRTVTTVERAPDGAASVTEARTVTGDDGARITTTTTEGHTTTVAVGAPTEGPEEESPSEAARERIEERY